MVFTEWLVIGVVVSLSEDLSLSEFTLSYATENGSAPSQHSDSCLKAIYCITSSSGGGGGSGRVP